MSGPITPHKDPRSDWRPDSNPIYDKTNDAIESSTKPVVEAVHKQTEQGGWQGKIDRLDSKAILHVHAPCWTANWTSACST